MKLGISPEDLQDRLLWRIGAAVKAPERELQNWGWNSSEHQAMWENDFDPLFPFRVYCFHPDFSLRPQFSFGETGAQ
jgi:hypothetical protein